MKGLGLAGLLWLVGGAMSFVVTIVFRTDALQWVLTIASGLGAVVLGLWLIVRPNTAIVPGSIAVGIAWLIIFALLTAQQAGELVAWSTDVFLAVIGVAAAVVTYAAMKRPQMVATIRVLLIVQAACGVLAMIALSVLLLDETTIPFGFEMTFAAFTIALVVLVAWIAFAVAIALALFGQCRVRGANHPRWLAMTGLEAFVIFVGLALEVYLLEPTLFRVPAPPAPHVVLGLVVPALAAINLATLFAIRMSTEAPRDELVLE